MLGYFSRASNMHIRLFLNMECTPCMPKGIFIVQMLVLVFNSALWCTLRPYGAWTAAHLTGSTVCPLPDLQIANGL